MHKRNHAGFTIIELIVTIIIIGILATLVIVGYTNMQERAYSARVISAVDDYAKGIKLYHTFNGHFPDYGSTWGTCLGRTSDYPAADGFPAGACYIRSDGSSAQYASDNLYNELKTIMDDMPDPTLKIAEETYGSGVKGRYRGIYYEHQNNSPGSTFADWAYVEYVVRGKVPCPQEYVSRYSDTDNVTFCSQVIYAGSGGTD